MARARCKGGGCSPRARYETAAAGSLPWRGRRPRGPDESGGGRSRSRERRDAAVAAAAAATRRLEEMGVRPAAAA
eukprot:5253424-Alexandrium_andersonii.AAC.1